MRDKKVCPKCGKLRYPHQHHILPKALFGKIGFFSHLCSDCHEEYHESLRKANPDNIEHPPIFYVKHFIKWMSIIALGYFLFKFL